jgi:ankyrin repeat protein
LNVRRGVQWWIGLTLAALVVAAAALLNHLRQRNAPYLQSCMAIHPQPLSWLCGKFFYRYHPTPEEVKELNAAAGVRFAFEARDEADARRQLKRYLDAGVDINATDERTRDIDRQMLPRFTALHGAVLAPNLMEVKLLLEFGASIQARDGKGRTALDLARELQARSPRTDREEILRLLEAAAAAAR